MLQNWLFGVAPVDGLTLSAVTSILLAAAVLASLVPALKAARTDPLETLTME